MDVSSADQSPDLDRAYREWVERIAPTAGLEGWTNAMHRETPGAGISIYTVDVLPEADVTISVEGPPTFSLTIFLAGDGKISVDGGKPLAITPKLAVICSTERFVRGSHFIRKGQRLRLIDIRFDESAIESIGNPLLSHLRDGLIRNYSVPDRGAYLTAFPASDSLLHIGHTMLECPYPAGDVRNLYLKAKAMEALALAFASTLEPEDRPTRLAPRDIRKVDEAKRLLEQRLQEPWTIARLAQAVSLNEKKLKAGFRHNVGRSIHAYLTKVRLEAAASMLDDGESVTNVSLAIGFGNLSHFSKIFRDSYGMPPSAYARRHRLLD